MVYIGNNKTICPRDFVAILAHLDYPIKVARKPKYGLVVGLLVYAQKSLVFKLDEANTPKFFGDIQKK